MKFSQMFPSGAQPPEEPKPAAAAPAMPGPPAAVAPASPSAPAAAQAGLAEAEALYHDALATVRQLVRLAATSSKLTDAPLPALVDRLLTQLQQSPELLHLTGRSTTDNYLIGHIVNVTILSLAAGRSLGFDAGQLRGLGLCALLYDLGMAKLLKLAESPHTLSGEAFQEIKAHPRYGLELLQSWGVTWEGAADVVQQHHERGDGSGYPSGLTKDRIHAWAQLIGLVDVYEGLTHPRAHRQTPTPAVQVIAVLLRSRGLFSEQCLKALLDQISLYPVGTWVKLSTGEYGQVSEVNAGLPMRPVVSVQYNPQHRRLPVPRHVNLREQMSLLVEKVLDTEAITKLAGGAANGS